LSSKELEKCLNKADWYSYFAPTGSKSKSLYGFGLNEGESKTKLKTVADNLINAIDHDEDGLMNFAEYLFLRKSAVAWRKCVSGDLMTENDVKCALEMAANAKIVKPEQAYKIMDAGLDIQGDLDNPKHLNFIVFL